MNPNGTATQPGAPPSSQRTFQAACWGAAVLWVVAIGLLLGPLYLGQIPPESRGTAERLAAELVVVAGVLLVLATLVKRGLSGRGQVIALFALGVGGTAAASLWMGTARAWGAALAVFLLAWVVGNSLWPWLRVRATPALDHFLRAALGLAVLSLIGLLWTDLRVWSAPLVGVSALALAGLAWGVHRLLRRPGPPRAETSLPVARLSHAEWAIGLGLVALVVLLVLLASLPDVGSDALSYHLVIGQDIAQNRDVPDFDLTLTLTPQSYHMLLGLAIAMGGMPAGTYVHTLFAILCLLGTLALGAALYSRAAGLVAGALVFATPLVLDKSITAYCDLPGPVYALALAACLYYFAKTGGLGWAALAGADLGMLYSIKYFGLLFGPVACVVLLLAWGRRDRRGYGLAALAMALLAFAVAGGPWLARTWLLSGSPVFPMLNSVFRSPYAPVGSTANFGQFGLPLTPLNLLLTPYWVTAKTHLFSEAPHGAVGGLLLLVWPLWALGPSAFAGRRWFLGVLALVYMAGIWAVAQYIRYGLTIWPLLALLAAGALVAAFERREAPSWGRWGLGAGVAAVCGLSVLGWGVHQLGNLQAVRARTPAGEYLIPRVGGYRTLWWTASHVPKEERLVGFQWVVGAAYAQHRIVPYWSYPLRDVGFMKGQIDGEALWRNHRMRYLLVGTAQAAPVPKEAVGGTHITTVYDDGVVTLFRVDQGLGAAAPVAPPRAAAPTRPSGAPATVRATTAPTSAQPASGLAILAFGPDHTRVGRAFNPQQGAAALWFRCRGATRSTEALWDRTALPTVFGRDTLVSASVPAALYAKAGKHTLVLRERASGATSNQVTFTVEP